MKLKAIVKFAWTITLEDNLLYLKAIDKKMQPTQAQCLTKKRLIRAETEVSYTYI